MWRIVQQDTPGDVVLATGETHAVREFVELAFAEVGRTVAWSGQGADEIGADTASGEVLVKVDPHYYRPTEVDILLGDPSKAHAVLGWRHTTPFAELVRDMVAADLALMRQERDTHKSFQ